MKKLFKWIGIAFVALIVLGIVGAMLGDPKKQGADGNAAGAAPPGPPAPPLPVNAAQLFKDYGDNEVAADQKYKGKRLAVTGSVQSIDKDAFDNIVIKLRTTNEFMSVNASFDDKHEQMAASLKKGVKVNWVCDGAGLMIGSPMLRNCAPV